jgi:hypothetical protein
MIVESIAAMLRLVAPRLRRAHRSRLEREEEALW